MKFSNSVPAGFPSTMTIGGEEFPLYFTISPHHSHSWAYVMVDDLPTATIQFFYKKPYKHSIERAEAIIKSLRKNDHKLFCHHPISFGIFDKVGIETPSLEGAYDERHDNFDLAMIDDASVKVDVYSTAFKDVHPERGVVWRHINHLFVTNEDDINFVIFDKAMMKEIIARYNVRKEEPNKIRSDSHKLPADMTGEA